MPRIAIDDTTISLPMPIFLVIEDVGWWEGADGSSHNAPYRSRFGRRHCLADYEALTRLAERLSMRIGLGMVMGEWDRTDFLRDVPGATWMGRAWENRVNQGPWLEETAGYLRDHGDRLELALHGICHEFWEDGRMERSEFHDIENRMRPRAIVKRHLDAVAVLLEQNGFTDFPRLFIPPALHHSFGNGKNSIQTILHDFGIDFVTTRFSKARQYAPPRHPNLTWECGVAILERGRAPVEWDVIAAPPRWHGDAPILPLHWGNLLHPDPDRNPEIVDAWADMIIANADNPDRILAKDLAACWRQAAACGLAAMHAEDRSMTIDLGALPDLPCFTGPITLKIQERQPKSWHCIDGEIIEDQAGPDNVRTVTVRPKSGEKRISFSLDKISAHDCQ